MRYKKAIVLVFFVILLFIALRETAFADSLNSDWVGTLDKSYELSWQQCDKKNYNGYRNYFFLEYTYLMRGNVQYPSYCIEYYLKGPRNNDQYGKHKLMDCGMPDSVKKGLIEIMRKGYPIVQRPYGTLDVAEAYYATSAAIHIWTMYYGVDELAGENLGWFKYKDGFRMDKNSLNNYMKDYSTKSTASGWHAIAPNDNAASRRTWIAAMKLLLNAMSPENTKSAINIKQHEDYKIENDYLVFEFDIDSNLCTDLYAKLEPEIKGYKIEYINSSKNRTVARLYLPLASINSHDKFKLYATGILAAEYNEENFYYLYHLTGKYQTMVYLDFDSSKTITSSMLEFEIPNLEYKIYYDLNYSGKNYIKNSDFFNIEGLSYQQNRLFDKKGSVAINSSAILGENTINMLKINYSKSDSNNCLLISTLLNDKEENGFDSVEKMNLVFSCWIWTNNADSVNICFENSETIYEKKLEKKGSWQHISVRITKLNTESNVLCIYPNSADNIIMKQLQLEEGVAESDFIVENAPASSPVYTEHKMGEAYARLYNNQVPEYDNYIFLGWNTKKDGSGTYVNNNDIVCAGNKVLYAIWKTKDAYNVYYHFISNGGEALSKNGNLSYASDGCAVATVPTGVKSELVWEAYRTGYEFLGWSLENNLTENIEDKIITSVTVENKDVHLYANFKRSFKIRFHYYDEASASEQIISTVEKTEYNKVSYKGMISLPSDVTNNGSISIPKLDDFRLKGWSINPYEELKIDYEKGEKLSFTSHTDYYAVYEKKISVSFYDNVYESKKIDEHSGSSYLHERLDLKVCMSCAGNIIPAEFNLPLSVCEVEGFNFYGWSDKREFNGSVVYFAAESGRKIKTTDDIKLYALYAKEYSVSFYDYNFSQQSSHLDKEIIAYKYMNYNSNTYVPEIIMPYCCTVDGDYEFIGWNEDSYYSDTGNIFPEEKVKIYSNTNFYANYKNEISIRYHYLENNDGKEVVKVSEENISGVMDYCGGISVSKIKIPEITSYNFDGISWTGQGFSEESSKSYDITHYVNKSYFFEKSVDLYAIYSSDITINYHDYSIKKNESLESSEKRQINRNCDRVSNSLTIRVKDMLSDDVHDSSGWTDELENKALIKYKSNESLEISKNIDFYSVHIDNYQLTCLDLFNDEKREQSYSGDTITQYDGNIIPAVIVIPNQGNQNSLEKTDYWSKNSDLAYDYKSGEEILLYSDVRINAIYKKPVKLIYDANGGIFKDNSAEISILDYCYYNVDGKKKFASFSSSEMPTKRNYIFADKWNTSANGNSKMYSHGETIVTDSDLRIYAMWNTLYEPKLSVIDRYFFVGDLISYDEIISKVIAINSDGNHDIDSVNVVAIDKNNVSGLSNEQKAGFIKTNWPCTYKISVEFNCNDSLLKACYNLIVVDKLEQTEHLRYISADDISTIAYGSKWYMSSLCSKLIFSLQKEKEEAKWKYTFEN